jgi:hypothetical protein
VAEEMLHFALAANLLVAVGGEPEFLDPALRATYPVTLPSIHPPIALDLAPATDHQIRSTFLVLEQPDPPGRSTREGSYDSLGEFYADIADALTRLSEGGDLFADPQAARQLSDPRFYGPIPFNSEGSGDLMLVDGPASAQAAIDIIVHQGEGLDDIHWADADRQELTHYAKLLRIADGVSPLGAVRPARVNPRVAAYPTAVRPAADLFNATYAALFLILDRLYRPSPRKTPLVSTLYRVMSSVLGPLGRHLMTIPLGDGTVAGPTFEPFDLGPDPATTLADLASRVASDQPELASILGPLIDRSAISAAIPAPSA